MKLFRPASLSIASLFFLQTLGSAAFAAEPGPDPGQISISVGRLMEQGHYSRHKLDPEIARRLLTNYLETLDYGHLFFTQQDVDAFNTKFGAALSDDILLGNPDPAVQIYDVYKKRVEERVAKVKKWISTEKFDFKSDRTVVLNRQKAPWPKDDAEADQLWRDRIEGELLQEKLVEHPLHPPVETLNRRYDQIVRNLHEQTHQDAIDIFLSCLAQTYDPHSEYMSKSESDNFKITMGLHLIGIGAVLHSEDGYAKIMDLVPGGPAQKEGHLKVGDRIAGVAQGSGEFADVFDMKLDKIVAKIRGKKDTKVRLQVIPAHATDPSTRKIIEITRAEVQLKDQAAKADLIEKTDSHGTPHRLGWITLPSFYADMDHSLQKDATSTTRDVKTLLTRLKAENISGLVIDLRKNGGGSLEEAINLTNLFVKKGPVVQVKDANGKISVLPDRTPTAFYDGPLIILCNTLSASASEIFAGAMQDYGRAVIVGDHHTFGKGTVQTMLDLSHFIPFLGGGDGDAGELKLTIQKFYRIAGGSTQLHGVASDVVLPSLWDIDTIGESALKGPMPYDEVPPASFDKVADHPLFLEQLRQRSAARVAAESEFRYIEEDLAKLKQKLDENRVSLNEKVRREEIAKEKALKEKRIAQRAKHPMPDQKVYAITLDNADKPELELAKNDVKTAESTEAGAAESPDPKHGKKGAIAHKHDKKVEAKGAATDDKAATEDEDDAEDPDSTKSPKVDPVRIETLNILTDLVDLSNTEKTASVNPNGKAP